MNFKTTLICLLAAAALPLAAEDKNITFQFKAGWVNSQGQLRALTENPTGYGGEVALNWRFNEDGFGFGFHGGFNNVTAKKIAGHDTSGAKTGIIGVDFQYPLGKSFQLYSGPVLATYDVTDRVTGLPLGENPWKMGWRVGLQYDISKEWGVSLNYTQTAWIPGNNPSFATLMATYKF